MAADFFRFSRTRSRRATGLVTVGALLEGAGLLMLVPIISLIMGDGGGVALLSEAGITGARSQVAAVLAVFALILVARFAVVLLRDDLLISLELDFVADLRGRAFARLASMPWAEVVSLRQSPVGHALTRDADRAANGVGQLVQGVVAVFLLVVQLAVALWLAPLVTMAVALFGLVLMRALRGMRQRAGRHGEELTAEDLAMFDATGAFLSGLKPAKAHGLEPAYLATFANAARRVAASQRAYAWDYTLSRLLMQSAAGVIAMGAILGGVFVLATPPEHLVVALIVMARLSGPLQALQNTAQSVAYAAPGYRAIRGLAGPSGSAPPERDGAADVPALIAPPGFTLRDVGWAGEGALVLSGITASIPAGQITAIAGESGAGKSTLLDLLTGLLTPSTGEVELNGIAPGAGWPALRASLAYVGQEPFLFHRVCGAI